MDEGQKSRVAAAYLFLGILLVNASFLSYKYYKFYSGFHSMNSFDCHDDCDSVMMSQYGRIFGIPTPIYGLIYFMVLTIGFYLIQRHNHLQRLFEIYLGLGCLIAIGFIYLLRNVLQLDCPFCMTSHLFLFLFAWLYCLLRTSIRNRKN